MVLVDLRVLLAGSEGGHSIRHSATDTNKVMRSRVWNSGAGGKTERMVQAVEGMNAMNLVGPSSPAALFVRLPFGGSLPIVLQVVFLMPLLGWCIRATAALRTRVLCVPGYREVDCQ